MEHLDSALNRVAGAQRRGRLNHALLLVSATPADAEHVARAIGNALLCGSAQAMHACGNCAACQSLARGLHPDLHVLMPPSESVARGLLELEGKKKASEQILVDDVRELVLKLRRKPQQGGARVAIVLFADRMNANGQNALLKTLEEPPSGTTLMVCTNAIEALLPTIRSRCQTLRLPASGEASATTSPLLLELNSGATASQLLALAESIGRDRTAAEDSLENLARALADAMRTDTTLAARYAEALDEIVATQRALAGNANTQLTLERLLLRLQIVLHAGQEH